MTYNKVDRRSFIKIDPIFYYHKEHICQPLYKYALNTPGQTKPFIMEPESILAGAPLAQER